MSEKNRERKKNGEKNKHPSIAERRGFLKAIGGASVGGITGISGCLGGSDGDGGDGGDGSGDGSGDGGDGDGGNDIGNGGSGNGDGTGSDGDSSDGNGNDGGDGGGGDGTGGGSEYVGALRSEDRKFALTDANTSFEGELSPETVQVDPRDALIEEDVQNHRYTFDSAEVSSLKSGDILLVPGRALRRVSSVKNRGSETVVDTEFASLDEAMPNADLEWDADLSFEADKIAKESNASFSLSSIESGELVGVDMVDRLGRRHPVPYTEMTYQQGQAKWSFSQGDQTYKFILTPKGNEVGIKVQVTKESGGKANLAYTADGNVGTAKATGNASLKNGDLESLDLQQKKLTGDLELSISAAGSGFGSIDWEFPGLMLKFVVMAGPVPITVGIETKLIGSIKVPAEASATASSKFSYDGDSGISYDGSDVDVDANMASMNLDPDPADSAANIGNAVDAQFGVAFPRVEISVFDQFLIPYLHTGMIIGSSLNWGPICKRAYVKLVVEAGYDFKILGTQIASEKVTLAEEEKKSKSENCE